MKASVTARTNVDPKRNLNTNIIRNGLVQQPNGNPNPNLVDQRSTEKSVNFSIVKTVNKQLVDPVSGIFYDSLEVPRNYKGNAPSTAQGTPPPTVRTEPQTSTTIVPVPTDDLSKVVPKFKDYKRTDEQDQGVTVIQNIIKNINKRVTTQQGQTSNDYETRGDDKEDDEEHERKEVLVNRNIDLNQSFSMEFTPTPPRFKRLNNITTIDASAETSPSKKAKTITSEVKHPILIPTPRSSRSANDDSTEGSIDLYRARPTRLLFEDEDTNKNDGMDSSDDEILSQVDLNLIEISSKPLDKSITQSKINVKGEGFEDSDSEEDAIFSQLKY